jgi:hypothetical protein
VQAIVGTSVAAQLMGQAGGLSSLAKVPSGNLQARQRSMLHRSAACCSAACCNAAQRVATQRSVLPHNTPSGSPQISLAFAHNRAFCALQRFMASAVLLSAGARVSVEASS